MAYIEQQVSLTDALHIVHRPPPDIIIEDLVEGRHPAQKRLVIERAVGTSPEYASKYARIKLLNLALRL